MQMEIQEIFDERVKNRRLEVMLDPFDKNQSRIQE